MYPGVHNHQMLMQALGYAYAWFMELGAMWQVGIVVAAVAVMVVGVWALLRLPNDAARPQEAREMSMSLTS